MKLTTWNRMITVLVVLTAVGCGGSSAIMTQTIAPSPTPNVEFIPADNTIYIRGIRKVAVFPFADYSKQQSLLYADEWGGNIKIQEAVLDQLIAHGLSVAVQEDVNTLLVDHDIIRPIDSRYLINGTVNSATDNNPLNDISSPEFTREYHTYTQVMRDEINQLVSKNKSVYKKNKIDSPILQGATVGLSKDKVVELAEALDVDLIIRGRIVDYGISPTGIFDKGMRPAVMQVRMYVQDGATGDVLWSNRVEMEYSPSDTCNYQSTLQRARYEIVVREGVKALMDEFFAAAEGVFSEADENMEPIQKEGT